MFRDGFRILTALVEFVIGVIEFLLVIRFLLKLFGANPVSPFVKWIYDISGQFLAPFGGIFPSPQFSSRIILELNTLFAILVYAIIGYILTEVVKAIYRTRA